MNKPLGIFQRLRRSALMLPLAAVAAVAALLVCGINEAAYLRSTCALASLGERLAARAQIQLPLRSLINAATGQRGYLLTGRTAFLAPYQRAGTDIPDHTGLAQAL